MIHLELPFPVSANALYRNRLKGRAKSDRYATWINAAGWSVKEQKQSPVRGWYRLTILLYEADDKIRDPGNMEKCVSDLLVRHGLVDDDHKCVGISIERYKASTKKCRVIVTESNGIPHASEVGEAA